VVVLDYGSGNLRSAERALVRAGADVTVSADPGLAFDCDGLVVPGVGAFAACMAGVLAVGGAQVVRARVAAGRPLLGICVGMQVLFEAGDEHGCRTAGIGVLAGQVSRLTAPVLPHMGWNTVRGPAGSALLAGLAAERFYFVHSYAARDAPGLVGVCDYGGGFAATVEHGCVSATQFHPEKSSRAGLALLTGWVSRLPTGGPR
jgi:glutamine amidotransferase